MCKDRIIFWGNLFIAGSKPVDIEDIHYLTWSILGYHGGDANSAALNTQPLYLITTRKEAMQNLLQPLIVPLTLRSHHHLPSHPITTTYTTTQSISSPNKFLHMIRLPQRPPNIPHPNQLIQTLHKRSQQLLLSQPALLPDLGVHPKPVIQVNQPGRGIGV